jgi:hypothetical protein
MFTHIRRMFQWISGLVKLSPEELQQAGVHLGRLGD